MQQVVRGLEEVGRVEVELGVGKARRQPGADGHGHQHAGHAEPQELIQAAVAQPDAPAWEERGVQGKRITKENTGGMKEKVWQERPGPQPRPAASFALAFFRSSAMVALMPAVPFDRTPPAAAAARPPRWVRRPAWQVESLVWLGLLLCVVGLRWWGGGVPCRPTSGRATAARIWHPATGWLKGGPWVTRCPPGARFTRCSWRGSSNWAARCGRWPTPRRCWGAFTTVLTGGVRAGVARAAGVLAAGGLRGGVRVLRDAAGTGAAGSQRDAAGFSWRRWRSARGSAPLRTGSIWWLAASGIATGMMQLLKGIFPVFPVIVVALVAWNWRGQPRRAAALVGVYAALFCLPLAASKLYSHLSGTTRPAEPEDGQMFYGTNRPMELPGAGRHPARSKGAHPRPGRRLRRTLPAHRQAGQQRDRQTHRGADVEDGHRGRARRDPGGREPGELVAGPGSRAAPSGAHTRGRCCTTCST